MPARERIGPTYPVNLLVRGLPVLVVGGGRVALDKVRGLLDAGADVTVVSPEVVPELRALPVRVDLRPYRSGEAASYRLAVAATGDPAVNQAVHDDAEAAGVWVNSVDDPERCTFIVPARVRRGDLLVTISTGGRSPAVASYVREQIEELLAPEYEALLDLVAEERDERRGRGESTEGLNWRAALRSGMLDKVREGDLVGAKELLRTCLSSPSA